MVLLLAAMLVLPVAGAAQGPAGAGAGSGAGSRSRASSNPFASSDFDNWQFAVGYQYNRINLLGTPFNTNGINLTVTRYFRRWFGVDGQVGIGLWGDTGTTTNPPNLGAHSVFVGGGPRLALRGSRRIEPWVHALVGLQNFRFTQTAAGPLGSNHGLGMVGGGGADFALNPHLAVRVEADFLETRLFSAYQRHFQMVGGFVVNF
jgi:hypothetical protein